MNKLLKRILMVTCVLSAMSVTALGRELTLERAIDEAIANSKDLKIAEKDAKISKINVSKAIKNALPSVTYSGTYTRSEFERDIYKYSNQRVSEKGGFYQNIKITQPVFRGGAVWAGIYGGVAAGKASELTYILSKVDVRLTAIQTYCNILKYQRNLETLETSRAELTERYKLQEAQRELNLITNADLLKTKQSLLDVETQILDAEKSLTVEKENLKTLTGIHKNEDIKVTDFQVPSMMSNNIDFKKDLVLAATDSTRAQVAKLNVKTSKANKLIAAGDMLPTVNAFASYGTGSERTKIRPTVDEASWQYGVEISWDVFNFGSNYDSYRIAKLQAQQEEIRESKTQDTIDIDVKSAYLDLIKYEKSWEAKATQAEAARETYAIDKERYNAGLISTSDLLESEKSMRTANMDLNAVILDYYYAFEKYRSLLI